MGSEISFLNEPEDPAQIAERLLTMYPGSKMIKVKFTLLCGEESYKSYTIDVASEITYAGLKDHIIKFFNPRYQQIYFRGEELPIVGHPLRSVEDGEELFIKHFSYDHWKAFERHCQNARLAALSRLASDLQEHVELAISEYEHLDKSCFLSIFSPLRSLAEDFLSEFYLYCSDKLTPSKFSSNTFFSTLYGDDPEYPTLKVKWKVLFRDTLLCKICDVYRGETLLKTYYVRFHSEVDLRVLFMYKLLEILCFGPKVHFYHNAGQRGFCLYTASEEGPGSQNHFNRSSYGSLTFYQVNLITVCFHLRNVMNRDRKYGKLKIYFKTSNSIYNNQLYQKRESLWILMQNNITFCVILTDSNKPVNALSFHESFSPDRSFNDNCIYKICTKN